MNQAARVLSVFSDVASFTRALRGLRERGLRNLEVYSPVGLPELEPLLPRRGSPVRFVTLVAVVAGCGLGFWMCIGSALIYRIIVGGKPPAGTLPCWVIGFELSVLLGGLATLAAIVALARLGPTGRRAALRADYRPEFGEDEFGISVICGESEASDVARLLRGAGAREVHARSESIGTQ